MDDDNLPSVDEALGDSTPSEELPSVDDALKPLEPSATDYTLNAGKALFTAKNPMSSPAVDAFFENTAAGRIASAFGHGVSGGLDSDTPLGIAPGSDVEQALTKYGMMNDHLKGERAIMKSFNEALIRPAATFLDAGFRGASAVMGAVGGGIQQTANEIGAKNQNNILGELPAFTEYELTTGTDLMQPHIPMPVAEARSVGAIGETEAAYFGLEEPTPQQAEAREHAATIVANAEHPATESPPLPSKAEDLVPPTTPDKTVHDIAREVDPDTFRNFDTMSLQKQRLQGWIDDLATSRDARMAANPPHAEELEATQGKIDELLGKVNGVEDRLTKKQTAKLQDLRDHHDDLTYMAAHEAGKDSADMAHVREQLVKLDENMRTLAPDVSAAYREAETRMPPEKAGQEAGQPPESVTPPETPEAAAPEGAPETPPQEATPPASIEEQMANIEKDVKSKVTAAGRPAEEAGQAAKLVSNHYRAVAEQGWAKGTIEEIYKRDFADVKGQEGARRQQAKGLYRRTSRTIHLLEGNDASTFIHETGHHFLDEMDRYAKAEDAPADLKAHMKTVNDWLKRKNGVELTRGQHEKFARGFEKYMLTGTAPSKGLAGVFKKFKQWLNSVYSDAKELRVNVSPAMSEVFDRLLSKKEEPVVAPEPEPTPNVAPEKAPVPGQAETSLTGEATGVPDTSVKNPPMKAETPPESPETPASGESRFVDKAGNIRLDLLNLPEDVNQVIRDTADKNDNFMGARRGVVSDGKVLDLARALGESPQFVKKLLDRGLGVAFNAEQIQAAIQLLEQSATNVRDLARAMESGKEEDIIAFAEADHRHMMIQEQVSGITAEAGRALRAFQLSKARPETAALGDILKQNLGTDIETLRQKAKFISQLDKTESVSQFIKDSRNKTFKKQVMEYYINALLSGPVTHARYSVGNALNALWTPLVEIPTAAGIGKLREMAGGEKNIDRVYLGEAGAQLRGLVSGSQKGLQAGATAWKTGLSPMLPGEELSAGTQPFVIPGTLGKVINVPSRSVAAIHSFFKSLRYEQNIHGLSYRMAMQEGLEEGSEAFTNRVADLTNKPTEGMTTAATDEALKNLYMAPNDYDSFAGKLTSAVNSNMAAKIIMPFMKVGSQITREAFIESTPLGFLTEDVRGRVRAGGAEADFQLAKMAMGTALIGGTSAMVLEGLATGDGPADPAERAVWLLNHKPNSIQIGDITLPYQGLGKLGMLMRFSANMTETAQGWEHHDGIQLAQSFMEGVTKSVLDENFMRGLKDMLDAAYHPKEYGENYIKQFATNWLPFSVGLGQVNRSWMGDPYQRETSNNIIDAARAKIPLLSEGLQPKRDRFGVPIKNGGTDRYKNDPVVKRMEQLQTGIGKLERKINGVQLSDTQYDQYAKLAGQMTKMRLNNFINQKGSSQIPAAIQIKQIHSIISSSREYARGVVMMNHPQIAMDAYHKKVSGLK